MLNLNLDPSRPIVFVADIHIKPKWSNSLPAVTEDSYIGLQEYLRVIKEHNACAVILGGDIFDVNYVKHVWLQKMFFEWVDAVVATGCQVLAYPGNHDYVLSQEDQEHPVHIHSIHPKIVDIDREQFRHGERRYACIGHRALPQELYDEAAALPADVDTLLLHQLISSCGGSTNLNELPATVKQIIIGDVHEFADGETVKGAWWGYPGAMYPQKVNECEHGTFVVDSAKNSLPMREPIVARKAKVFEIAEELSIEATLTQAEAWVSSVDNEFAALIDKQPVLAGIRTPVIQLRVVKHLTNTVRTAIRELEERAHIHMQAVTVQSTLDIDLVDAKDKIPTPIEILPTYIERLKQDPQLVAAHCPYPDASAEIVNELLLAGAAGHRAGDAERRHDGGLLSHHAIIAAAMEQIDKEFADDKCDRAG